MRERFHLQTFLFPIFFLGIVMVVICSAARVTCWGSARLAPTVVSNEVDLPFKPLEDKFSFLYKEFSWSNVSKVVFEENGNVYLLTGGQKGRKILFKGHVPKVSPDGRNVAYLGENASCDFRLFDLDKMSEILLPSIKGLCISHYVWSRHSDRLAITVAENNDLDLYTLDTQTGSLQWTVGGLGKLGGIIPTSWTESDKTIVGHDLENIYEIDPKGKVIQRIPLSATIGDSTITSEITVALSRDRSALFIGSGINEDGNTCVFKYDIARGVSKQVSSSNISAHDPYLSDFPDLIFVTALFDSTNIKRSDFRLCMLNTATRKLESCGPVVGFSTSFSIGR